eukprot:TRINITY_DN59899_c0_g1_i1.p3 TRINITY_DN59899_c0_g1~~TRINITY_DN59899_c0_g1_i1.p3  ORF type:complete len:270 (-),score=34.04 TRINITY_DN59899_c0_g1_i1:269-1078(-)
MNLLFGLIIVGMTWTATALQWRLYSNREDCISEWAPNEQWNLLIESLKRQGKPTDNVNAHVIISIGFLTVDKRNANNRGAVDIQIKSPSGEVVYQEEALEEKELEVNAYGGQGPWQICMKISKKKGSKASVLLDLTYMTINQRSLVGTAWEMLRRDTGQQGQGQQETVDLMAQLVSKSTELADKTQIAELSKGIYDLDALLMAVVREQRHVQHRTEAQLQVVAGTKSRMLWWSFVQALIIVAASLFQVYMVRQLFERKAKSNSTWGRGV